MTTPSKLALWNNCTFHVVKDRVVKRLWFHGWWLEAPRIRYRWKWRGQKLYKSHKSFKLKPHMNKKRSKRTHTPPSWHQCIPEHIATELGWEHDRFSLSSISTGIRAYGGKCRNGRTTRFEFVSKIPSWCSVRSNVRICIPVMKNNDE